VSEIQYLGINENFPVAGQDNDTQVFRDNFDTIKESLRVAQSEVEALQDFSAKLNQNNDFDGNKITNGVFENIFNSKFTGGSVTQSPTTIDYRNGSYQIYIVAADINVDFLNLPGDPNATDAPEGQGEIVLEFYNDGTQRTVNFVTSGGTVIKKDPSFPATLTVDSDTDPTFVKVWRHNSDVIFMQYLGVFS